MMILSSKLRIVRPVRCSGRLNSKRLILKAKTTDSIGIDDDPEAKYRRYGPWFGKNFVLPISSIFEGVPRVRVRTNDSRRATQYLLELPWQASTWCFVPLTRSLPRRRARDDLLEIAMLNERLSGELEVRISSVA